MLPVLMTFVAQGRLTVHDVVRMACQNPARLYGIQGKGTLETGAAADIVLVDPRRRQRFERPMVASKCGWSPYEGEELTGWPVHTVLGGRWIVRDGGLVGLASGRVLQFS
jgi:dihydroorotase